VLENETEARPDRSFQWHWLARTEAEREAAFQRYLEISQPYMDKITADGDESWHKGDVEARRELFYRRWKQPKAPVV